MQNFIRPILLLLVAIVSHTNIQAQNTLTDLNTYGNFQGPIGTGYSVTNYGIINPVNGTSTPGKYAITTNPNLMNSNYISEGDHTGGGKMMVIDGATSGFQFFWTTGSCGCPISGFTVGQTYTFSFWVKSVSNDVTSLTQSVIQPLVPVGVGGADQNPPNIIVPLPAVGWQQVGFTFTATATSIMIRLTTQSTSSVGNDFAVDDFSIVQGTLPLVFNNDVPTPIDPTCPTSSDGSITASASFGKKPYSYTITGPKTITNATGVFNGLPVGTYNISVTDSNSPSTTIAQPTPITLSGPPNNLLINPDTPAPICSGEPTTLTASGGKGGYTWTASPADPTLTTPNNATITVSPTQTTTYTVTSGLTSNPTNFIANGDFSFGNSDFTSDYLFTSNPAANGQQKCYGIVTNPKTWFNSFSTCTDNTTGDGRMYVADGSTNSAAKVWTQNISGLLPNQDYDFSYYIQSVSSGSVAKMEVLINGVSLGPLKNAPASTCQWILHKYTWNSGSNTSATITIYDRETSGGGNDFAIDDIAFTESVYCSFEKKVTITVNGTLNLNIFPPAAVCSPQTVDITDAAVTAGSSAGSLTYWTDAAATTPLTNANSISLSGTYYIKISSGSCSAIKPVLVTINSSGSVATPAVNSPINYCQNGTATPLTAIPAPGATLNWYGTNLTGGTATTIATTPSTAASEKYYVSQTIGTCESPRTEIEVIVSPPVAPTFDPIAPICQNATAPSLPGSSTNSPTITGTWNPSSIDTSSTGNKIYTFTPNSGSCTTSTLTQLSVTITASITPDFANISFCEGSSAPPLKSTSPNGISGTWSPATIDNTSSGSYLFTPNATLFPCAIAQTLNVTITPKVVTTVASIGPLCQDALAPVLPTTSTNSPTINGTWNDTIDTSIPGTKTYIFTPSTGVCASTASLPITINSEIIPSFDQVQPICSGTTLAALPIKSKNNITGNWFPAIDNTKTTTYTFTPDTGQCTNTTTMQITVNLKSTPTFKPVPDICLGSVLSPLPLNSTNGISGTWSPALNNTATTIYTFTPASGQCATPTQLTIAISSGVTISPLFNSISPICAGQIVPKLPTTSLNAITGIWTPDINPNTTTTYTFTPDSGQCATSTTLQISINPLPTVITSNDSFSICSGSSTAISLSSDVVGTTFTWNVLQANVKDGSAGSGSSINQVLSTAGNKPGEAIYAIYPIANGCPGTTKLVTVTVNPIPEVSANPSQQTICSGATSAINLSSTVGQTTYSWTVTPNIILGSSASTGDSISQTLVNTTLLSDTAIYLVTPSVNGCLGIPLSIPVTVNPTPQVFGSGPTTICSEEFTNIALKSNILGSDFSWTAIQTGGSGAKAGTGNVIEDILKTGINVGTVIYSITPSLNECKGNPIAITIKVNPLPSPSLSDGIVCLKTGTDALLNSYLIESGLSTSSYDFEWFLDKTKIIGAIGNTYEATEAGNYSIIVTDKLTRCVSKESPIKVTKSYPVASFTTIVSDAFTENAIVTVTVQGATSSLLYQIDGGEWQRSNVFANLSSGNHTINIIDEQGCTNLTGDVFIIDYPKFFTPNGDGSNDKWNIVGLNDEQSKTKIFIYDRYGKLLKQISTQGEGWDGTFNGYELPATDYWFTIDYLENNVTKLFKAHFSLKR